MFMLFSESVAETICTYVVAFEVIARENCFEKLESILSYSSDFNLKYFLGTAKNSTLQGLQGVPFHSFIL